MTVTLCFSISFDYSIIRIRMVFRNLSYVTWSLTAVVNPCSEDRRPSIATRDKKKYCFPNIRDHPAPSNTTWCFCSQQLSDTGRQNVHGSCSEQLFPLQAVSGSIAVAFASLSSLLLPSKVVMLFCSSSRNSFCHFCIPKIFYWKAIYYILYT